MVRDPGDPPTEDEIAAARRAAAAVLRRPVEDVRVRVRGRTGRPRVVTDAQIAAALASEGSIRAAARALGISDGTIRGRQSSRKSDGSKTST
jgi:hypothetical protein